MPMSRRTPSDFYREYENRHGRPIGGPSAAAIVGAALSPYTETVCEPIRVPGPIQVGHFGDAMGAVVNAVPEPCHTTPGWIVMSRRAYADLKVFGRDVLDIDYTGVAMKPWSGAILHGFPILTPPSGCDDNAVWVVACRKDGPSHKMWVRQGMVVEGGVVYVEKAMESPRSGPL